MMSMNLDHDICYDAVRRRDRRFDGRFFTGVTSTGVYCRPICPARTPRPEHCTFFACAAAAEAAGFRPCLRCRPETAPGSPAWEGTSATVARALRLIGEGALDSGSVPRLAARLGLGERQLRRLFDEHLGVTPAAVARSRRVHFARQLLDVTDLPVGQIALAAGFRSVRRFNAAVKATFGRTPTELRDAPWPHPRRAIVPGWITLTLPVRPPYDWSQVASYLAARALPGVEEVAGSCDPAGGPAEYRRFVVTGTARGLIAVRPAAGGEALELRVESALTGALLDITRRALRLFDCAADPVAIGERLGTDPWLAPLVRRRPGLRIPGAWSRWELAVRALLGQQVSVARARTLAGRVVERFGTDGTGRSSGVENTHGRERAASAGRTGRAGGRGRADRSGRTDRSERAASAGRTGPAGRGWRAFPPPERLVAVRAKELGIPASRARALRALATTLVAEPRFLADSAAGTDAMARLGALPGIGPWTAGYIALRALGDPDALPAADLGLRRALARYFGGRRPTPREIAARAENWRPWRGYAVMHLWHAE